MRRFVSIPAMILLAVCLAGPAAAAPPERTTFTEEGSNIVECGAFMIVQDFTIVAREKVFFDRQGNPIRVIANIVWDGTLTNTTTGFTVRDNAAWTFFLDFRTEIAREAGLIWNLNIPGQGIVALDAGTITYYPDGSVEYSGPHQVFEEGEALLCSVMDQ
jgi:hypothetical protein